MMPRATTHGQRIPALQAAGQDRVHGARGMAAREFPKNPRRFLLSRNRWRDLQSLRGDA